jgi:hypothetical protein
MIEQSYGGYGEPDDVAQLATVLSSLTLEDFFDHGLATVLAGIEATVAP